MGLFIQRSFRLPRQWSNQILRTMGGIFTGEVINVSGWQDQDKEGGCYKSYFSQATAYYISNHSGIRGLDDAQEITDFEIDLEAPLADNLIGRFDVVFSHTTLEHVFAVGKAFENLCAMSRDVVIVVVPFAQEMHFSDAYGDYWRFTPMTFRRLFSVNGFNVVFEAANNHKNAGLYIVSIGSRYPEKWINKIPPYSEVTSLGDWIGWNPFRKIMSGIVKLKPK